MKQSMQAANLSVIQLRIDTKTKKSLKITLREAV